MNSFILALNYIFAVTMPYTHIGGYVAVGAFVFVAWFFRDRLAGKKMLWPLAVFIAYGLVLSAFSSEPRAGFQALAGYFTQWALPFMLGAACCSDRKSLQRLFYAYFISFSFLVFLSVLAFFGLFYKQFGDGNYFVRAGLLSGLRSHIALGALCLLFSFLSIAQAMLNDEISRAKRKVFAACGIFFLIALILTTSRGYYISAAISYSLFVVSLLFRRAIGGKGKYAITLVLVMLFLSAAGAYFFLPPVKNRLSSTGMNDPNVQGRLALYSVAFEEIKQRPIFGFGPGQGILQAEYFKMLPDKLQSVSQHTHLHSFYLNLLADFGVVGFILFVWLMAVYIKSIRVSKGRNGFGPALSLGLFWGLFGILIGDCFDTLLRGPGVAMEIFWLAGLVMRYNDL